MGSFYINFLYFITQYRWDCTSLSSQFPVFASQNPQTSIFLFLPIINLPLSPINPNQLLIYCLDSPIFQTFLLSNHYHINSLKSFTQSQKHRSPQHGSAQNFFLNKLNKLEKLINIAEKYIDQPKLIKLIDYLQIMRKGLLLFLGFSFFILSRQEPVQITCQQMDNCQKNGFTYSILQGNTTQHACTDELVCPFEQVQVELFACTTSISGETCNSGICYYTLEKVDCVDEYFQECSIEGKVKIQCDDCEENQCESNKCLIYNGGETCKYISTCAFESFYIDRIACQNKKDFLGNTCNCCGKFMISGPIGKCVDNEPFYSDTLKEWTTNLKNTFQVGILMKGILVCVLLMVGWL